MTGVVVRAVRVPRSIAVACAVGGPRSRRPPVAETPAPSPSCAALRGTSPALELLVLGATGAGREPLQAGASPIQIAVVPLGVPYLLNPAGIVVLVTALAEAASAELFALVVGLLIVVFAIDVLVFR